MSLYWLIYTLVSMGGCLRADCHLGHLCEPALDDEKDDEEAAGLMELVEEDVSIAS